MSGNGAETPKQASPYRPRHQISRSITELSSPIRLGRHHHAHHRRDRSRDERVPVPQSAAPVLQAPPRSSLDYTRSEYVTPNLSRNPSRRASVLIPSADDDAATSTTNLPAFKKVSSDELLHLEREKAVARTSGLKKCLVDLNEFSNATTRRLDETYYSVLEKLSVLQSTVVALKELAGVSQEMTNGFKKDAQELVSDTESQLGTFGQFNNQEQRIESLQDRVRQGRQKMQTLSERVDAVRERIEGWERADRAWQERTRKRLKIIWIITSVVFLLLILLFIGVQYSSESLETTTVRLADEALTKLRDGTEKLRSGSLSDALKSEHEKIWGAPNRTADGADTELDGVLRIFDEL